MAKLFSYLKNNPLTVFVLAIPLAFAADLLNWGMVWVFIFSALGVVPMAGLIGKATESLAVYTGPRIGGLLNATLGNAAELIITLVAVKAGLLDLVKASITGSIIGNLLLVLGLSVFVGGLKNGIQKFDRRHTGNYSVLLIISIAALVVPSLFSHSIGPDDSFAVEALSLSVAGVMIVLYIAGLIYTLKSAKSPIAVNPAESVEPQEGHMNKTQAIALLVVATLAVVFLSELLVKAVEVVVADLGISEFFLGIILIPVIGNVAEHLVAVSTALRNQMDLSIEISVSSSLQIALFVAPLIVFISLAMGHPLTLIFNQFELLALGASVAVASVVSADGESNWLEGAGLLAVYLILAAAFFLLPTMV
jgi:Ca2+:H+ antiporter